MILTDDELARLEIPFEVRRKIRSSIVYGDWIPDSKSSK